MVWSGAPISPTVVKDLTARPVPMAGGFWGGFASEGSMEQIGGKVKRSVPLVELSHPVEHVVDRLPILFLGLEDATVHVLGELAQVGGRGHVVALLVEDLLDVGVGSGLFHAVSLQGQGRDARGLVPPCQLVRAASPDAQRCERDSESLQARVAVQSNASHT